MDYSCCFSLGGNLDFLDFLQKKFYNIDYTTPKILFPAFDLPNFTGVKKLQKIWLKSLTFFVLKLSQKCHLQQLSFFDSGVNFFTGSKEYDKL